MSRFISAGTDADSKPRDDAWLQAQKEVEAQRKPKPVIKPGEQEGGKSLYEVLQQNKAAKQDAFEEQARLKNQFRALDEDEIEFLESVNESVKAKETAVEQETAERLEAFRRQRAAAEQSLLDSSNPTVVGGASGGNPLGSPVASSSWTTKKKKRRRDHDAPAETAKLRKMSSASEDKIRVFSREEPKPVEAEDSNLKPSASPGTQNTAADKSKTGEYPSPAPDTKQTPSSSLSVNLGLHGYSSDDD